MMAQTDRNSGSLGIRGSKTNVLSHPSSSQGADDLQRNPTTASVHRSALAMALALAALTAGSARDASAAIPGYEQKKATATVVGLKHAVKSVTCPTGKVVFGGGARVTSPALVHVVSSYPSLDGKKWTVEVSNANTSSKTFEVFAQCGNKPTGYYVDGDEAPLPAYSQAGYDNPCHEGYRALGGGAISYVDGAIINSTYPLREVGGWDVGDRFTPGGWGVYMNNNSGSSGFFEVRVICAGQGEVYGLVAEEGPTETKASGSIGTTAVAACRLAPDDVVLSGGVYVDSTSYLINLGGNYPFGSSFWGAQINSGPPTTFRTYAVCASLNGTYAQPR